MKNMTAMICKLYNTAEISGPGAPTCTSQNPVADLISNAAQFGYKQFSLVFSMIFCLIQFAAAQSGQPIAPPGVQGFELEESYRLQQSTFWVLPEGRSILEYTDQDKVFMREYDKDVRKAFGKDAQGRPVSAYEILNPQQYFVPQTIPYRFAVLNEKDVRFYGMNGEFQWLELRPESEEEDEMVDFPNFPADMGANPLPTDLPEGFELTPNGFIFMDETMRMEVNRSLGLVSTEYYDSNGAWDFRMVEILDTADPERGAPLFQIRVTRRVLPSEECAFQVVSERYSEYFRKPAVGDNTALTAKPLASGSAQASSDLAKIWPNPASDMLYVSTSGDPLEAKRISLISLDGRVMAQNLVDGNQVIKIPLSGAAAGVYLVKIESGTQTQIEKVIIK